MEKLDTSMLNFSVGGIYINEDPQHPDRFASMAEINTHRIEELSSSRLVLNPAVTVRFLRPLFSRVELNPSVDNRDIVFISSNIQKICC